MNFQDCNCSNSYLFTSTLYKPETNSSEDFFPLPVFILLLSFKINLRHKIACSNSFSFCHHHLDFMLASVCASSSLLLTSTPNGALQHVLLATRSVLIVFFALQVSSSLLGVFKTSLSLLFSLSTYSIPNLLLWTPTSTI